MMCAIGRYDTCRFPAKSVIEVWSRMIWPTDSSVQSTLLWLSITPFGGPVVPDV